ncbi:hypothetical protein WR25_11252 [Diploscapter pachys]|uniref:EGF-like domain-containing protein n=1 Tax=Diploscapter pachys TaxID=2018661 RepID=A0A2A2KNI4_9BILA|nr:hypothetical protein WR25_11252 [Diploscapter pachys]
MSRGNATVDRHGNCTCDCDKQYFGKHCQFVSPCYTYECENGAKCDDVWSQDNTTVTAICNCPTEAIQFIPSVTFQGDRCEQISIPDTVDVQLIPCDENNPHKNRAFIKHLISLIRAQNNDRIFLNKYWLENYHERVDSTHKSAYDKDKWCSNMGECTIDRVTVPTTGHAFLLPSCRCKAYNEGSYCEYYRENGCEPTLTEAKQGKSEPSICPDRKKGTCVMLRGQPFCDCKRYYVGETCETYNPCADNPCIKSECIVIGDETEEGRAGEQQQAYQCLCNMEDGVEKSQRCVYEATGNCTDPNPCFHGKCLTCEHEMEQMGVINLCSPEERKRGFRCICESGFLPPRCKQVVDACYRNLCENEAVCVPRDAHDYDCDCINGTEGILCENIFDPCAAFGESICQFGVCQNSLLWTRGFECLCHYGYRGINCQIELTLDEKIIDVFSRYYYLLLPLYSIALVLCVILCLVLRMKRVKPTSRHKKDSSAESGSAFRNGTNEKMEGRSDTSHANQNSSE